MASRSCHFFRKCDGNLNAKCNGKQLCNGKCNANPNGKQLILLRILNLFIICINTDNNCCIN
jgi:hypothetical protein